MSSAFQTIGHRALQSVCKCEYFWLRDFDVVWVHMLAYFGGLVLGQGHMVLVDFGVLVLEVDYSVVGCYILGTRCMEYVQ